MKRGWKPALLWSGLAIAIVFGLQVYVTSGDGVSIQKAAADARIWVFLWPFFFLTTWVLTSWRDIHKKSFETSVDAQARRAVAGPMVPIGPPCPKCGFGNPTMAVHCVRCGLRLKEVEVLDILETLPGARESAGSVLYVLAFVGALVVGGLALALLMAVLGALGRERWLENDLVLIAGFMGGAGLGLLLFMRLIRAWAERRSKRRG